MVPGLRNPYANCASKHKKRQNRPWDASANDPYKLSCSTSRTISPKDTGFQQCNDSFDCDIDWDAALRIVDAVEDKDQFIIKGRTSTKKSQSQPIEEMHLVKSNLPSIPISCTDPYHNPQRTNRTNHSNIPLEPHFPKASSTSKPRNEMLNQYSTSRSGHELPDTGFLEHDHVTLITARTKELETSQPKLIASKPSSNDESKIDCSDQPSSKWQKMCARDTISMLRPESWRLDTLSTTCPNPSISAHSASNSSVTVQPAENVTQNVSDPRQNSLPLQLQFDPKVVAPIQDSYRSILVSNADLSSPLLNGWKLFPHQKKAILRGILMRRMILALDMGLGKTLIGCVWAKAFVRTIETTKVIVVCPVSLKKEWKRTAEEATGLSVSDGDSEDDLVHHDVIIVSWAKIPAKIKVSKFVVVADEAHTMQSMQATRTKNALQLMGLPSCVGVLLLTGTPMKNGKPCNLFPLLRAVQHPLGRNQRMYETHFCAGREIQFGNGPTVWSATGSSNVSQLRELSQSHLLYLSKESCLKDLPAQTRIIKKVPVSSRMQAQHNRALNELAKVYQTNPAGSGNEAVLGATQKLRMISSLAKVDAAIELAIAVLNEEAAIVIFTSFVDVAKMVHRKLMESGWNTELLTGETPANKRQDMVDNFQNGLSPVFISTFGAGGVGLTLTAACTVILIDRPWTPGEANQAEDRVRRIGQTRPVKSIWISAFDLDAKIDLLLESKTQTANEVLRGNSSQSTHQQGSIIPLILKAVLSSNNSS